MTNQSGSSDPVDPLLDYSTLSLFPRTFRSSSSAAPDSRDPHRTESLHSFLKSMALKSPNKLLEQAKTIVDSGSELLSSKFPSNVAPEGKNEPVILKGNEKHQERRPALGRKRAQFSLKPNSSVPSVSLEPNLDIDQLQDPEEYFLAHEKLENAKRELQRQRGGVLMDFNQQNPSTTMRHRRPGILGRSVSYKHHYSSTLSDNNETFVLSQETSEQDILSPSNYSSQLENTDPNVPMQERELASSVSKAESKVNELLDELLSGEDLDGDGALNLLQERLQIKPIDVEKLCLPDLHDIRRNDFKASGLNLPKPKNSLSDIHYMVTGLSNKTPVMKRQDTESSAHPLASPTPPKSPFSSISLLKKRLLQSNTSQDPFSALNIDLSPGRNPPPVELSCRQSDQVDMGEELNVSGKLKSLMVADDDTAVANTGSSGLVIGDRKRKQETESSAHALASPGHIKSPFASISLLKKRILQSNTSKDPVSAVNIDLSPAKNSSPVELSCRQSDQVDMGKELNVSGKLKSLMLAEDDTAVANTGSSGLVMGDSIHPFDNSFNKNLSRLGVGIDAGSSGSHGDFEDTIGGINMDDRVMCENSSRFNTDIDGQTNEPNRLEAKGTGDSIRPFDDSLNDNLSQPGIDARSSGSHGDFEDNIGGSNMDDRVMHENSSRLDTNINGQTNDPNRLEDKVEDMLQDAVPPAQPDVSTEGLTKERLISSCSKFDQSHSAAVEHQTMDGLSKVPDTGPVCHIEQEILEPSRVLLNEQSKERTPVREELKRQRKTKRCQRKEHEILSRRKSLAGAGMSWQSGVRRSTRIRTRPLEFWKGERFLYGRIHESLATVIGLKYVSPSKDEGKPTVKVKSYVSDEYKELVEFAALH